MQADSGLKLVGLLRSNEMARKGMSALMSAMLQHELNLLLNSRESTEAQDILNTQLWEKLFRVYTFLDTGESKQEV